MPTLNARFSSPSTLRSIRPDLLVEWLRPSAGYLEDRGLKLPEVRSPMSEVRGQASGEIETGEWGIKNTSPRPSPQSGEGGSEAAAARRIDYDRLTTSTGCTSRLCPLPG